jgi:hypothetical protein
MNDQSRVVILGLYPDWSQQEGRQLGEPGVIRRVVDARGLLRRAALRPCLVEAGDGRRRTFSPLAALARLFLVALA